jgi:hypothetical protein
MVAFGILNAIGMAPSEIQDIVVNIFGTKGTGVMTNVPGPRKTIYLAGAPLDTIMFWVPQSGHLGLGVSIISYAGQVWLGIATDEGLAPDPESIVTEFHTEFEALSALTKNIASVETESIPTPAPDSIETMTAALNDAIQKVTALLEKSTTTPIDTCNETSKHCQALTKAGRTCKNPAVPGSDYCHVHNNKKVAPSS